MKQAARNWFCFLHDLFLEHFNGGPTALLVILNVDFQFFFSSFYFLYCDDRLLTVKSSVQPVFITRNHSSLLWDSVPRATGAGDFRKTLLNIFLFRQELKIHIWSIRCYYIELLDANLSDKTSAITKDVKDKILQQTFSIFRYFPRRETLFESVRGQFFSNTSNWEIDTCDLDYHHMRKSGGLSGVIGHLSLLVWQHT